MTTQVIASSTTKEAAPSYVDPTARVDLMPPDILAGRKVRAVQRKLILVLVLVVVAIGAGFVWFRLDDSRGDAALRSELATVAALQADQATYAELPAITAAGADVDRVLADLMVDDLAWHERLLALSTPALGEIRLTGVTANVADVAAATTEQTETASTGLLDPTGADHVGVLTVTGQAPSHEAVAAWVESLSSVDGFLVPYILGSRVVLEGGAAIEFTVEVTLGSSVRSLRYPPDGAPGAPGIAAEGGS